MLFMFAFLIFADENLIYGASSVLQGHHEGTCAFCGMTRSFVSLAKGNFSGGSVNEAAIPLFSILVLNQIVFIIFIFQKSLKRKSNI